MGKGLSSLEEEKLDNLSNLIPSQAISSISLLNHNVNKNTIDNTSDLKFKKKYGNNMSVNKIVENLTFRLPRSIKPVAYNLLLHPDLKTNKFTGNVKIDIQVSEQSPFVALHSKFLKISQVKLMKSLLNGLEGINVKNSFMYEKFEFFIIEPETQLAAGNYTIDLDFDGALDGKIVGFYSSTYFDTMKNQTR